MQSFYNDTRPRTQSDDLSIRSFSRSDSIDSTSSTVYSYMQQKPSPRNTSGIACDESLNNLPYNESFSSLESVSTNSSTVIVSPVQHSQLPINYQAQSKPRPMSAKYRKRRDRESNVNTTRIPTPIEPLFPRANSHMDLVAIAKSMSDDYNSLYDIKMSNSCKLPDISHKPGYH